VQQQSPLSASDLWNMATNEAQMRSRFQDRIKVEGPVFQVKKKYGYWHLLLMTHENPRGVDGWIDCAMTSESGLASLSQGTTVVVEGVYEKGTGAVVHLAKCRLLVP